MVATIRRNGLLYHYKGTYTGSTKRRQPRQNQQRFVGGTRREVHDSF